MPAGEQPQWPSVQAQIRETNVVRGSALEKLINENQDFQLLQPEEADDDAGLPPWLRVWWRKNHPELEHPTVNPGAGYPDVLYTIYTRMLSQPDLPWDSPTDTAETEGDTP